MTMFRKLFRCEGGTSVIELALVLPTFSIFLLGMAEIGKAYSAKLQVEQAAQRAIEKVQQYQASTSTFSTMKTEAATAAGITETTSNPTVDWWLECNGVRSSNYATPCSSGQIEARWITVRVQTTYTPMFFKSRYLPKANANGTFTLTGEAGVRTQ